MRKQFSFNPKENDFYHWAQKNNTEHQQHIVMTTNKNWGLTLFCAVVLTVHSHQPGGDYVHNSHQLYRCHLQYR